MSFELTTTYPFWYILLCLLTGAVYAMILYFRASDVDFSSGLNWLKYPLAFFRFSAVTIIALLLLNPLLRYVSTYLDRPKIILATDDSESVALGMDSTEIAALEEEIGAFTKRVSDKFEVVRYTFGESVSNTKSPSYDQKITDVGMMMDDAFKSWKGQNVSAMLLISDGIVNQGMSPERIAAGLGYPVYAVPLGDTTKRTDLGIREVRTNAIAYLGNSFPVIVDVSGRKLNGKSYEVALYGNGTKLASKRVIIDGDDHFESHEFELDARETGTRQIVATVSRLPDEVQYLNNRSSAYIDIIDGRQKIVLIGSAPHPDMGAIRRTLEPIDNYELRVEVTSDVNRLNLSEKEADLVILHQIPSSDRDLAFIQTLLSRKVPILFVTGRGTSIQSLHKLDLGLRILDYHPSVNKAIPLLSDQFVLFELSPGTREAIPDWPPLDVPFGKPAGGELNTLLNQQIGRIKTNQALLTFVQNEDRRTGFLLGEGFWKWSLQDYNANGHLNASTELLRKVIQYLSVKSDKRQFRVYPDKRLYYENDVIGFHAELYNDSYEPVNNVDVNIKISKGDETYDYLFSKSGTGYKLHAGMLPAGEYKYYAITRLGGKKFEQSGTFVIRELKKEHLSLEADYGLMTRIAMASGGRTVAHNRLDELAESLLKNDELKPVVYSENSFRELLHLKWIFVLVVSLLTLEWAIRKWNGGY